MLLQNGEMWWELHILSEYKRTEVFSCHSHEVFKNAILSLMNIHAGWQPIFQRLALAIGWSRYDARNLALAALVHDLGKTWIANEYLEQVRVILYQKKSDARWSVTRCSGHAY